MSSSSAIVPHRVRGSNQLSTSVYQDDFDKLLVKNKAWAARKCAESPDFFREMAHSQSPQFLWIGCSDSRVPANQILGLDPGEVFVQRNVGNQASHTDLNTMSCMEYAVQALKVKTILVCGHYNCGAVKAALTLPCGTPGLVNCWISGIRDCRNIHADELRSLPDPQAQLDLLCELNVKRQVFQVCTSPVVQAAWAAGQQLAVYGVIYSLKDGMLKKLVGPINRHEQLGDYNEDDFVHTGNSFIVGSKALRVQGNNAQLVDLRTGHATMLGGTKADLMDSIATVVDTQMLVNQMQSHLGWARKGGDGH